MADINIREMRPLSLKPGDLLIMRLDDAIDNETIQKLHDDLAGVVPEGVHVLVLEGKTTCQVYRPVIETVESPG